MAKYSSASTVHWQILCPGQPESRKYGTAPGVSLYPGGVFTTVV